MTERPSQTRQILEKLDNLTSDVSGIKEDLAGIKKQIEYQPKIDNSRFDAIAKSESVCRAEVDRQFTEQGKRIKQMEDNQTWLVRAVIGEILGLITTLIILFAK